MMILQRRGLFVLLLPLLLPLAMGCGGDSREQSAPRVGQTAPPDTAAADDRVVIKVGGRPIRVRISQTPEEMERGLMFTEELPDDEGMLFVFEREKVLHFWMKNTLLPLSVAFIDKRGRIVEIERMDPLDEETAHSSRLPALYALEMNAGWFQEHGVKVGDRVEF
jgi:uncharacterized membrane protein (UPF0127 family)